MSVVVVSAAVSSYVERLETAPEAEARTTYCLLHTPYCLLHTLVLSRTTYCLLHPPYCLLRTTYCLLHTPYCGLPLVLSRTTTQ